MRNCISPVVLSFVLGLSAVAPGDAQTPTPAATVDTTRPVRIEVPNIIFSGLPALLVLVEGDPVYQNVDGTPLQRIVNTKVLILRDEVGAHYLKILDGWMQAYSLGSWWEVTRLPPEGADLALRRAVAAKNVDLLDSGQAKEAFARLSLADGLTPTIFVSTTPAVLVATDGPPRFVNVPGTSLDYIANTTATVFREPTDHELYVLASGRWFRSWKPEGPWQFIASDQLPADFAKIPDSRLKSNSGGLK